jgi:hypothetical protein
MFRRSLVVVVFAAMAAGILGCGEKSEQETTAGHGQAAQEMATQQISTELAAVLAKADAVDGTEDHVISKCPGCKLNMAGKASNAMQVGDYSLHFCSATCKDNFAAKGEEAILALEIPEADGHEGHGH